jgi:hypothetical protein
MQFENHLLSFDGAKVRPFSESCTKMGKKYAQTSLLCAILISTFSKTGYITDTSRSFLPQSVGFHERSPSEKQGKQEIIFLLRVKILGIILRVCHILFIFAAHNR